MSSLGNELLVNDTVVSSLPLPLSAPIAGLPPGLGLVLRKNKINYKNTLSTVQKVGCACSATAIKKNGRKGKNKTGRSVKINVFPKIYFQSSS
jgi:hypothetical protein